MNTTGGLKQTVIRQPIPGLVNVLKDSHGAGVDAQSEQMIDEANIGIAHSERVLSDTSSV